MPTTRIWSGDVWEDASFTVEGRVPDSRGVLLTASTVSSWSVHVFDSRDSSTPVFIQTGDGSSVIHALQDWDRDRTGKNFTHRVPSGSWEMQGGITYWLEYEWVSTEDGTIAGVVRITARRRRRR